MGGVVEKSEVGNWRREKEWAREKKVFFWDVLGYSQAGDHNYLLVLFLPK